MIFNILNSISSGVIIVSEDYKIKFVNKFLIELLGDVSNKNNYLKKLNIKNIELFLERKGPIIKEIFIDEKKIILKIKIKILDLEEKKYFILNCENISREKSLKEIIKLKNQKIIMLKTILDSSEDVIFIKDNNFKYTFVNKSFTKLANKEKKEILGKNSVEIFGKKLGKIFEEQSQKVIFSGEKSIELHKNGKYYKNNKNQLICRGINMGIYGIIRDITEIKKNRDEIYYDGLSKLLNRNFYENIIKKDRKFLENFYSIILIDIDNFKEINDTYGHLEGDKTIKIVAKFIKSVLTKNDVGIRMGGDEFLIFTDKYLDEAINVGEKLLYNIEKMENNNMGISLSIGIAEKIYKYEELEDVFKRADLALYKSKRSGKGQINLG
ncbi:PAS domain S-box-containing protein/diguanylate cyclase (GGDEF) domain-containing protein [Cetobacterium ceti]|uniref:PAS domain S-box-containing protein/diguanylate cyclase (GGDEF) domain-containing protein n=1 Tax=Cetobacterium ceti TaxID=180163 RepID=A0A1T4MUT5_9FUSO|nr:sensor domain-containing diguanylate cyclase [Cetobacterium ceti]SJZ70661.1 PAS domain S-box-containing protein/diguanylate cyclase (GGDEF) domain-containing protein [Cetobacterium ceti]